MYPSLHDLESSPSSASFQIVHPSGVPLRATQPVASLSALRDTVVAQGVVGGSPDDLVLLLVNERNELVRLPQVSIRTPHTTHIHTYTPQITTPHHLPHSASLHNDTTQHNVYSSIGPLCLSVCLSLSLSG
jgi:hypothetical protein